MSAQKTERTGVFGAILGLVGFSALAGVLVTAMVTPALAVTGITATSTIGIFDSLPDFIEIGQQPQQNKIVALNGKKKVVIATIYDQNREEVKYDQISKFALDATVAGEDVRFFEHGGVDIASVIRAAVTNAVSSDKSGASTLTMQLVKNIYVQQSLEEPTEAKQKAAYAIATAQTLDRKLKEMKLAIALEKKYSKKDILTAYLNIAFFGDNTYGIEAAAQHYYSVSAAKLTLPEAASLVAIVQEPSERAPYIKANYQANFDRRNVILGNMRVANLITEAQYQEAKATPVDKTTLKMSDPKNGCIAAWEWARFFCDYAARNVVNLPALGASPEERAANWKRGGYTLMTTLDMKLQKNAQIQTWRFAPNNETALRLGSATTSVQVGTGRILVMTENKLYNPLKGGGRRSTSVNFATDEAYGGSTGFQPGSTYKVFTLLNWLQNDHGLNETFDAGVRQVPQSKFVDTCNGPWSGPYPFRNDENEKGPYTVMRATARSVNSVFIQMAEQLDLCGIRDTAMSLGVHRADGNPLDTRPSSVLGINEIAPLTMAAAYAGIAGGGKYCKPIAIDSVILPDGKEVVGQSRTCTQALTSNVAATAAYAMAGVVYGGTAGASNPGDGVPLIGKTGTTNDSNQTWVVIASRKVATAVWVGNISGFSPIRGYTDPLGVQGSVIRHAIMKATLAVINQKYRGGAFPAPDPALLVGTGQAVPEVRGSTFEAAKSLLEGLGFTVEQGHDIDSDVEAGKVATSTPAPGTIISRGATVTLRLSKGNLGKLPDVVSGNPDYASAQGTLNDAGFPNVFEGCEVTTDPGLFGKVVSSDPAPGSTIKFEKQVTLNTGKATCP
jgi:membrane peptidoglycan carboxypeptidase